MLSKRHTLKALEMSYNLYQLEEESVENEEPGIVFLRWLTVI